MSSHTPLRIRLAAKGLDGTTLLVVPAIVMVLALFIYPFLYGLWISFQPAKGNWLANYTHFFSDAYDYGTIAKTLWIAIPATLVNVVISVPVALRVRRLQRTRLITAVLVLPITLGTVLVAQGLLTYLGPRGWVNQTLRLLGMSGGPVMLIHNYWGVFLSLVITGFPFSFLLILSFVSGIDPSLERAGAMLGARAAARFRTILLPLLLPGLLMVTALSFVQAFSVFPSAVLLGEPAGTTRVISIVAYHDAFEEFDFSSASAVAMVMAAVQIGVVLLLLGAQRLVYRGPAGGGKG